MATVATRQPDSAGDKTEQGRTLPTGWCKETGKSGVGKLLLHWQCCRRRRTEPKGKTLRREQAGNTYDTAEGGGVDARWGLARMGGMAFSNIPSTTHQRQTQCD